MKICGVVCSPRINGNTEILVREVLDAAKEKGADSEIIRLAHKTILPCKGCEDCLITKECAYDDDMKQIFTLLREADGLVLGTPVYFWSMSSQAKMLIDRTYGLLYNNVLKGKVVGIVVVARRGGCTNTFSLLTSIVNLHRMHLAGGVTAYGDKKSDVLNDKRGISQARALGKAMVELHNKLYP